MKNIIFYDKDTFKFHKDVISKKKNSKKDPTYKTRVSAFNNEIESQYKEFDKKFVKDQLEDLKSLVFSESEKETLHKLYSYKSKILQKLKIQLTTDEKKRIVNTCQNCTVGEINSFDHFIPKEEFAEYVVNPKNLFPSCTKCNSLKSTAWKKDNKRIFLNLYLDKLPKEQYLFVDTIVNADELDLRYHLENKYSIDSELFDLIENHYKKLQLFQRFKENSDQVISELEISIKAYLSKLSIEDIKKTIIEECRATQQVFGHNYWKSILKLALINDPNYINRFII